MKRLFLSSILFSTLFFVSCSTMSFIPTEGGASKFNLATVDYVQSQQSEMIVGLSEHVTTVLDSLLAEDRASLEAFTSQLAALDSAIMDFSARMDTSELDMEKSLALMSKQLTTVKTNASSTRMVIRRVNDNIDKLPLKALEAFNEAINAYLNKDETPTE
jgi:hypothetical protein